MFGRPAPCKIAINEMNAKETGESTYHLQVQARVVISRQMWMWILPHYLEQ